MFRKLIMLFIVIVTDEKNNIYLMVLTKPSNELAYHDWVVKLSVSVNILLTLFDFMERFHENTVL